MRLVRSTHAQQAFEEAYHGRDPLEALVTVAYRAARRGGADEVEICLSRICAVDSVRGWGIADELRGIARSVRDHPSGVRRGPKG